MTPGGQHADQNENQDEGSIGPSVRQRTDTFATEAQFQYRLTALADGAGSMRHAVSAHQE